MTINGIHLNSEGNRGIGQVIVESLLGRTLSAEPARLEAVRAAVLDKNWHWFSRYRTTDGNDVWGTRSSLAFTDGQTNFEVLQHELTQLDVMTANRDQVIWAAAAGSALTPDDSNVPAPVEVKTNLAEPQYQGRREHHGNPRLPQCAGERRQDDARRGHAGESLRFRGDVPGADQPRAARCRHPRPTVGGDVGHLPEVAADQRNGRPAADPS